MLSAFHAAPELPLGANLRPFATEKECEAALKKMEAGLERNTLIIFSTNGSCEEDNSGALVPYSNMRRMLENLTILDRGQPEPDDCYLVWFFCTSEFSNGDLQISCRNRRGLP
jgi:hypothetical protein